MDADKNLWDRHPACHSREGGNPDWLLTLDSQLLTRHSTTNLTNDTNRISLPGGHAVIAGGFNPWKVRWSQTCRGEEDSELIGSLMLPRAFLLACTTLSIIDCGIRLISIRRLVTFRE
jgi:hypothetical protein